MAIVHKLSRRAQLHPGASREREASRQLTQNCRYLIARWPNSMSRSEPNPILVFMPDVLELEHTQRNDNASGSPRCGDGPQAVERDNRTRTTGASQTILEHAASASHTHPLHTRTRRATRTESSPSGALMVAVFDSFSEFARPTRRRLRRLWALASGRSVGRAPNMAATPW